MIADPKQPPAEIAVARACVLSHTQIANDTGCDLCRHAQMLLAALAALEERPALLARVAELGQENAALSQCMCDLNDGCVAYEKRIAELEAVLRWFVGEFPCPEIHASIDNHPGRCPEDSDDPNEWCASARFQRALAGAVKP